MARTKAFHYYFRQPDLSRDTWHVTKWEPDGSAPIETYTINPFPNWPQKWQCDCLASMRYAHEMAMGMREDKHVAWLLRYKAIRAVKTVPDDQMIYYDSAADKFFKLGGSLDDMLKG